MGTNRFPQSTAMNEDVAAKVRNLIAEHLGVDANRISDEAHFRDLGADLVRFVEAHRLY